MLLYLYISLYTLTVSAEKYFSLENPNPPFSLRNHDRAQEYFQYFQTPYESSATPFYIHERPTGENGTLPRPLIPYRLKQESEIITKDKDHNSITDIVDNFIRQVEKNCFNDFQLIQLIHELQRIKPLNDNLRNKINLTYNFLSAEYRVDANAYYGALQFLTTLIATLKQLKFILQKHPRFSQIDKIIYKSQFILDVIEKVKINIS